LRQFQVEYPDAVQHRGSDLRPARRFDRTALLVETAGGRLAEMTFEHIQEYSRLLANALSSLGLKGVIG
jgi:hypothetical protein